LAGSEGDKSSKEFNNPRELNKIESVDIYAPMDMPLELEMEFKQPNDVRVLQRSSIEDGIALSEKGSLPAQ